MKAASNEEMNDFLLSKINPLLKESQRLTPRLAQAWSNVFGGDMDEIERYIEEGKSAQGNHSFQILS